MGTSGYQYDHWKETFYPPDLPRRRWFEHYRGHFDTVEINNTFDLLREYNADLAEAAQQRGIELKIARTGAAVDLFNAVAGERAAGACLHLTC